VMLGIGFFSPRSLPRPDVEALFRREIGYYWLPEPYWVRGTNRRGAVRPRSLLPFDDTCQHAADVRAAVCPTTRSRKNENPPSLEKSRAYKSREANLRASSVKMVVPPAKSGTLRALVN